MALQWVVNTSAGPKYIGGKLCLNGEGNWVDNGPAQQPAMTPQQMYAAEVAAGRGVTLSAAQMLAIAPQVLSTSAADASNNSALISAALLLTGACLIVTPGVFPINRYIEQTSYSRLVTAPGVGLKLAPGINCNMVRNYYGQQIFDPTTRVSISGNTVTFIEPGHNRSVGDEVYIENAAGNTSLNGLKTISALVGTGATAGWSVSVASGAAITNPSTSRIWVGRYVKVPAANVTRTTTTASVTWTSANPGVCTWVNHGRKANDPVNFSAAAMPTGLTAGTVYYVTPGSCTTNTFQVSAYPNGPALATSSTGTSVVGYFGVVTVQEPGHRRVNGDHLYLTGATGANNFNGPQEIRSVVAGVSWSYINPGVAESSSTVVYVAGDTNIHTDVWKLDYDADNHSFDALWSMIGVYANVGNSEFWFRNNANGLGAGVTFYNAGSVRVPVHKATADAAVNVKGSLQFASFCNDIYVGDVSSHGCYDDIFAWGFAPTSGTFGSTACPSGQGHMGTLTVDRAYGAAIAGGTGFKLAVADGYSLGSVTLKELAGVCALAIGDPNVGTQGFIDQVIVEKMTNAPFDSATPQASCSSFARINKLALRDPRDQTSGQNYFLSLGYAGVTMVIDTLIVDSYQNQGSATNIGFYIGSGTVTINNLHATNCHPSLGAGGDWIRVNGATAVVQHLWLTSIKGIGPSNAGNLVATAAGGTIQNVHLNGISGNIDKVLIAKSSQGSNMNVFINDVQCNTVVSDNSTAQQFTIFFNNLQNLGNNSVHMFVASGSGAWRIRGGTLQHQPGFFCNFGGTTSVSVDCPGAQIDLGANAGAPPARLVPVAGDRVFNSNGTGGGSYIRNAANSAWTLVA